jgi:hypothetical protein
MDLDLPDQPVRRAELERLVDVRDRRHLVMRPRAFCSTLRAIASL